MTYEWDAERFLMVRSKKRSACISVIAIATILAYRALI
jgi:hypothetical protein